MIAGTQSNHAALPAGISADHPDHRSLPDSSPEALLKGASQEEDPPRLYLKVAAELIGSIAAGLLNTGDRLPNERDLANHCGVSRATVRDALLALELLGVVEIRRGAGCYVAGALVAKGMTTSIGLDVSPRELIDARRHIEPEVARLCALHMAEARVTHLAELVDQAATASTKGDFDSFLVVSLAFHAELGDHCGNRILGRLTTQLVDGQAHPLWLVVNGLALRDPEVRRSQLEGHRCIVEAISAGDPERAASAMAGHLGGLSSKIFSQSGPTASLRAPRRRRVVRRRTPATKP